MKFPKKKDQLEQRWKWNNIIDVNVLNIFFVEFHTEHMEYEIIQRKWCHKRIVKHIAKNKIEYGTYKY